VAFIFEDGTEHLLPGERQWTEEAQQIALAVVKPAEGVDPPVFVWHENGGVEWLPEEEPKVP